MSESHKSKGSVRVYYQFPPKGMETSPNQITLEQVRKYFSGKPLRRGPDSHGRTDAGNDNEKTDPRPDGDKPSDPGAP